jgi:hypothetical protein
MARLGQFLAYLGQDKSRKTAARSEPASTAEKSTMSDIILPDVILRGVPRIVEYLRVRLNEPDLTESKVRGWIAYKKIRTYRFGSQHTAKTTELDEDVAGKAA